MNICAHLTVLLASGLLMAGAAAAQDVADTIYSGGPILTMNDAQPTAEAVAVKDGRIIAVGGLAEVEAYRGEATDDFDLNGRTMLPGFVDSHSHVVMGGLQALSANLLAPPDGEVTDIASLTSALSAWAEKNAEWVESAEMIVGFGYDNSQLAELRHPTREDLDKVSKRSTPKASSTSRCWRRSRKTRSSTKRIRCDQRGRKLGPRGALLRRTLSPTGTYSPWHDARLSIGPHS